jgi:hypothetical protein
MTKYISKPWSVGILVAVAVAIWPLASAYGDDDEKGGEGRAYAIGLWGDLPYSDVQASVGVPNLIADMNAQELAFTVHDGDLKASNGTPGSTTPTTCVDALYQQALGYFNALKSAAMFTPGDNDWMDCDRTSNGSFSPRERLNHERQVFFNTEFSLGQQPIKQEVQQDKLCLDQNNQLVACVENRRWTMKGVVYATLNIQEPCNRCDTLPDDAEFAARTQANILWMQQTFDKAKSIGAAAIMFISQANPGWDLSDGTRAPLRDPKTLAETGGQLDSLQGFLIALRNQVIAFKRPVVYVHGDSHYFRIDRPLLDAQGWRVENFLRVETFGNNHGNGTNDVHWVKVLVDDRTREVFAFQPQIVPANRTAVPAP